MTEKPKQQLKVNIEFGFGSGFRLDAEFVSSAVTGIRGPSGCGKSTLLNLVAGLLRPEKGHISAGEVYFDSAARIEVAPHRRNIGYVFQNQRLFPHLSVAKNIDFAARRQQRSGVFDRDEVIERLQLSELLQRPIRKLSGGQKQRTALARVLLSGPELLLLDEPLNAVESGLANVIMQFLVATMASSGFPVLLVTHSEALLSRFADCVLVMDQGKLYSGDAKVLTV